MVPFILNFHPTETGNPMREMNDEIAGIEIQKAIDRSGFDFAFLCGSPGFRPSEEFIIPQHDHPIGPQAKPACDMPDAESNSRQEGMSRRDQRVSPRDASLASGGCQWGLGGCSLISRFRRACPRVTGPPFDFCRTTEKFLQSSSRCCFHDRAGGGCGGWYLGS